MLELTKVPSIKVGLLIRSKPADVFQAVVDPNHMTKIWYSKSSGPMTPGAELTWTWETYGVSTQVTVDEVDDDSRVRFTWINYDRPTTVEFRFRPMPEGTYVHVTETGFTGTGDELVQWVSDSTAGFTFVLSGLKAYLEHDLVLGLVPDVHPADVPSDSGEGVVGS